MTPGAILTIDFDDTITQGDTIGNLISASIEAQVRSQCDDSGPDAEDVLLARQGLFALRDTLVQNYTHAFAAVMDQHLPKGGIERTPGLDMEVASAFLDAVTQFEINMNNAVVESGILRGLQEGDIEEAAKDIKVRAGAFETIQYALDHGFQVHILSVNWSALLIKAVVSNFACRIVSNPDKQGQVDEACNGERIIHIHANSLEMKVGSSTGALQRHVQGPLDKSNVFEDILLEHAACTGSGTTPSIFVGDSIGDLGALLSSDFPIIIGENITLRHALTTFGCSLQPLSRTSWESGPAPCGVMHTVSSWEEIQSFLLGSSVGGQSSNATVNTIPDSPRPQDGEASAVAEVSRDVGVPETSAQLGRVLAVAGSDSGGGAGIQADLKAILATGAFGMTGVTAITAQNTHGVQDVHVVPVESIQHQLDSVLSDIGADVIKTGMIPDVDSVKCIAASIQEYSISNPSVQLVVDPVLVSTSGHSLGDSSVAEAMKEHLFPLADVLTPNIVEAGALLGRSITTLEDMGNAAKDLCSMGPKAVLLKGGHLLPAEHHPGQLVDILCEGTVLTKFPIQHITTRNCHGTGCTLASAISSYLSQGYSTHGATAAAQHYVHTCLESSRQLSLGSGLQGPMDHRGAKFDADKRQPPLKVDYTVYAVTDSGMNSKHSRSMHDAVLDAVQGGATIIQIREKDCSTASLVEIVSSAIRAAKPYGVPIIVNDRVDVAMATGADGVHVGQSDMSCVMVRQLLGNGKIVGVSVKNEDELRLAIAEGANYVGAGAVFPTTTKDSSAIGLDAIKSLVSCSSIPVVAIGGVNPSNALICMETGCAGIAVVSCLFDQADVKSSTVTLAELIGAKPVSAM